MAEDANSKKENDSADFKTNKFRWRHGNKYWENVRVHPESGCKMTTTNIIHEDTNPCVKEYYLSMNCLSEKVLHGESCTPYFDNYRICKTFWGRVIKDRRRKGISPAVPTPAEREKIKQEYLGKKGFEL